MSVKITSARVVHKPRNTRNPWVVRYWTESGKQCETSCRTQRQAIDAMNAMLAESRAPQSMSFGTAMGKYLAQLAVKDSTRRHYRGTYNAHLADALGGRKLEDVCRDPGAVEALAQCGVGSVILTLCCGLAAWARREDLITDNRLVRSGMRHGSVNRVRQHRPYTAEQLAVIKRQMRDDALTVDILAVTGCRISEALALRPADFTSGPDGYSVRIERQVDRQTRRDVELKVAGKARTVPVPASLYRAVAEQALRAGSGSGRLTRTSYGTFQSRLSVAVVRAGLTGFVAHNFRHARAVELDRLGVPVADIARILGDTVKTVMEVYLNHHSADADALIRSQWAA